ncbi:MAG: glycerol-3-phosphate acyltransferase [Chloroflexi bacterium]|nr:glycerol-3-phosphate acyltransferase [Chloroflexota bacterium]
MRRASKSSLLGAGLLGYLVGSFPTADLVAKYVKRRSGGAGDDLRKAGSGNPGALNAGKLLGRNWGLIVLAGDMIKGAAACVVGKALAGDNGAYAAGTTAVVGHCYPAWSGFRGGKGVATSFGSSLVCFPAYAPFDLTVAAATFFISKGRPYPAAGPDGQPAARIGTYLASGVFSAAAIYWWHKSKGNLWGPKPTLGLPLYAFATSGVIAYRFLTAPAMPSESEMKPKAPEQLTEAGAGDVS